MTTIQKASGGAGLTTAGKLNNVAPGEPAISPDDVKSFMHAGVGSGQRPDGVTNLLRSKSSTFKLTEVCASVAFCGVRVFAALSIVSFPV